MIDNCVYVLIAYGYYDGEDILMVSMSYNKVKKYFDDLVNESKNGEGYIIRRFTLDNDYSNYEYLDRNADDVINWICKDYDGKIRDLKNMR